MLLRRRVQKGGMDVLASRLLFCLYAAVIFVAGVFGPVFIDRSISYHMAFFAAEHGELAKSPMERYYAREIFEKRFREAQTARFLDAGQGEDMYFPTTTARIFTAVMRPIGELTGSLGEYEAMKREMDEHE